jgi:hypothetical protein
MNDRLINEQNLGDRELLVTDEGNRLLSQYPQLLSRFESYVINSRERITDKNILPGVVVGNYLNGDQSFVYPVDIQGFGLCILKIRKDVSFGESYCQEMRQAYEMQQELDGQLRLLGIRTQTYLFATDRICGVEYAGQENAEWGNFDTKRAFDLHNIVTAYIRNQQASEKPLWRNIYPNVIDSSRNPKYRNLFRQDTDNSVVWVDPFIYLDNPQRLNIFTGTIGLHEYRKYQPVLFLPKGARPEVRKMVQLYQDKDMGPKLKCLALEPIPRKVIGANNSGIFKAKFIDTDGILRIGIAKSKWSTNLFAHVNAFSQLGLGMIYYGYADLDSILEKPKQISPDAKYFMLLSEVEGVGFWENEFSQNFSRKSIIDMTTALKIMIESGVTLNDTEFLVDQNGRARLVDLDYLDYRPPELWSDHEYDEALHYIQSTAKNLKANLADEWKLEIAEFESHLMQFIDNNKKK